MNKIEIQAIFFIFNTNPRFPPFLLNVRCKSGVTFIQRSLRDATVFDRPIVLGGNLRYVIGLDKVNTMTYSWHNVSPDYQSNIISYHNGTEYKRIEFSNGCYDYTELSDYTKETLSTNGDLEPDQASPIVTYKVRLPVLLCAVKTV